MKIQSRFLGDQEIDPNTLITFPQGLPGFESHHQFKLFHEEDKPTVFWLQAVDDAELMFSVAAPELFNIAYELELSDEDTALLELGDVADVRILMLLSKPGDPTPAHEDIPVHAHLKGPLLLNVKNRRAMQKVITKLERHTLLRAVD